MSPTPACPLPPAPWWLPGGHLQTIWGSQVARARQTPARPLRRERWTTPDQDFIDVDFQEASRPERPLIILFHGLEGSSQSHYARAYADWAERHDHHLAMPHFRGCSGTLNLAPRAYHSGDHAEIHWIVERLAQTHRTHGGQQRMAVGISLGGNALMVWAAEQGHAATTHLDAVVSVCSPLDLGASGRRIGQGLNRLIYTPYFLRTMVPKALQKLAQYPGLFDGEALRHARDLYDFDNLFTAPLHGFKNTEDYWQRASAKPRLKALRIPALLINAQNDPFIPAESLPQAPDTAPGTTLWQPRHGGHVGFVHAPWPGHIQALPEVIADWRQHILG